MTLSAEQALDWTFKLFSLSLILQSVELLRIRKSFGSQGIWTWTVLQKEFKLFPKWLYGIFDLLLQDRHFLILVVLRLIGALVGLCFTSASLAIVLFWLCVIINLRWRGSFNGGSDFMTLIVGLGLVVGASFTDTPKVLSVALAYIAVQTCTSYFLAGVVKIKTSNWRSGKALLSFLSTTIYGPAPMLKFLNHHTWLAFLITWTVLIFECTFPLALLNSTACLVYVALAFAFHLGNSIIFGLNRFLWAWVAAYPALIYLSGYLNPLT